MGIIERQQSHLKTATNPKKTGKLGKSTGEPIEDELAFSNDTNNNPNLKVEKKKLISTKLSQLFKGSFSLEDFAANKVSSISGIEQEIPNHRQRTSSSTSSEGWQLLESEDEEEKNNGPIDSNLRLSEQESQILREQKLKTIKMFKMNNNNNNCDEEFRTATKTRKQYISIDPLSEQEKLSPRLIHLCTALYALLPLASLCIFLTLLVLLVFTRFWFITVLYYTYVFLDRQTCNRGGRRWEPFYRAKFWSYLAAYFPIQLRHSPEFKLDPQENYILNYHPHGISAFGCVASFATNALNFCQLFPGITARFMVHETSYCVPLMREIFSLRGDCSVNSKSIDYFMEKKWAQNDTIKDSSHIPKSGNLLAWVGGGLAEADLSDAETLKIVVASRKGFVKKALVHGAHLIPCIAFGENSAFTKINFKPNSWLDRLESQWYRILKFKHPFYYGGSLLGSDKIRGAMPYKRPITVVMGDPIRVERSPEPTQQQVDELHARYLIELQSMYKANSDLCTRFDRELQLV